MGFRLMYVARQLGFHVFQVGGNFLDMAKKIVKKKDTVYVHCEDCEFCRPIKTIPNLDYRGLPFLCTCEKQPYERMMRYGYECRFFKLHPVQNVKALA